MTDTCIAVGRVLDAGILLNGRVLKAVQSPDSVRFFTTVSRFKPTNSAAEYLANSSWSSPSKSITTERKTRFSPRLISFTVPDPGDVKLTPSVFLSVNRICPSLTRSPTFTIIVGFISI